jgi:pyrroline-5-carboxylate reductase
MSLKNKTLAFIGAGNMSEALIRGLLAAKAVSPRQLIATDVRAERREFFEKTFGVLVTADNGEAARAADIVVLAVKPQQMSEVLAGLRQHLTNSKLVVSIAAGVTTSRIERDLGSGMRVVRVMPNTPALIGAGAAALAKGQSATDDDLATAETILGAVGITARIEEKLLDAVTALSGSGPAYIFYITEAMIKAGVEAGLPEDMAKKLALQTVLGAARLMSEGGDPPDVLRKNVTSPGGTTEAALKLMTDKKLVDIFVEAIKAAARRSQELSGR